jgi:hypothetical protein
MRDQGAVFTKIASSLGSAHVESAGGVMRPSSVSQPISHDDPFMEEKPR